VIMTTIKLGDLLAILSKEGGFYITDLRDKSEMFFQDSDDFYERPFARYMYDREVVWIEARNNFLNVVLK